MARVIGIHWSPDHVWERGAVRVIVDIVVLWVFSPLILMVCVIVVGLVGVREEELIE